MQDFMTDEDVLDHRAEMEAMANEYESMSE